MSKQSLASLILFMSSIGLLPSAFAQSVSVVTRFEVASIRSCPAGSRSGSFGPSSPGRIVITCVSLRSLISQSYIGFENGIMKNQQVRFVLPDKSPGWIDSDLYTIEAKAEDRKSKRYRCMN